MKQLRVKLQRLNAIQISVFLIIIGVFFGVLSANIFQSFYYERMMSYHHTIFTEIARENIDRSGLFIYILGENFREFVVFWLLSVTILGIPYMVIKLVSFGFSTGFFISAIAMQYGFKGILLILTYEFPHGILYLPIIILCLHKGYGLCRSIYYDTRNYTGTIIRQIKPYFLLWLLLSILLIFASFLEAYVGSFFLKKTLGLFI